MLSPRGPFSLKAAAEFGFGPTAGAAALTQVARIVSLDHDGEEFMRVGERWIRGCAAGHERTEGAPAGR
jgi:hypothetical protein